MRTDSFSQEKHLPVRRFIADESKVATGLYGPRAIAEDLDNLCTMFDPEADILGGTQKGGIGEQNLQDGAVSYNKLHKTLQQKIDNSATKEELEETEDKLSQKLETKAEKADTLLGYGIRDAYTKDVTDRFIATKQNIVDDSLLTEDKTIAGAINETLNRQNQLVTKSQYIADMKKKVDAGFVEQKLASKADKSTTLSGYGIEDAYTKTETEHLAKELLKETVLHQTVVDAPAWTNQPTFTGTLDSNFNTTDYYYVTLKDTDGNPLPAGQFKLMDLYDQYASSYETLFTLANLDTGNSGKLKENHPVEFTQIESGIQMRTAGVSNVGFDIKKDFQNDIKHIATRINGSFIKVANGNYFTVYYTTDKNVSNYYSGTVGAWNSDAGKMIWHSGGLGTDATKENQYCDEFVLERNGEDKFLSSRTALFRLLQYGTDAYKHYAIQTVGFGSIPEQTTLLNKVIVCAANSAGYIRNGTVITVTEVK